MAGVLILTHGLPGSGKSTWAEAEVEKDPEGRIRVNRDDLRTELFGESYHTREKFSNKDEAKVVNTQAERIKIGLREGKRVYADDTNLGAKTVSKLARIAMAYEATIEQEHFNVPVAECHRRNKLRGERGGREVPHFVINMMAKNSYDEEGNIKDFLIGSDGSTFAVPRETPGGKLIGEFNKQLEFNNPFIGKAVVLVDVDGTLADNRKEQNIAFGKGKEKDFGYFFRSIKGAAVNESVRDLANKMRDNDGISIVVLTGRSDQAAAELISFLKRSRLNASRVIVKREGDFRPDSDFKKEQLAKLAKEGLIAVHSVDDRARSIRIYESLGIMVSRVAEHVAVHPSQAPATYEPLEVNTVYGSGACIRCGQMLKTGNIGPICATRV